MPQTRIASSEAAIVGRLMKPDQGDFSPDAARERPYDLTIDLVSRMVETGLIPRDRRVFLRDGRLYEKMAKTKAHGYVGAAVTRAVDRRLPDGWSLWPESTIVLDPTNAPLPDFAVVRGGGPAGFR